MILRIHKLVKFYRKIDKTIFTIDKTKTVACLVVIVLITFFPFAS